MAKPKYKVGDKLFYINRFRQFMPCLITEIYEVKVGGSTFNVIYKVEVYHQDGDSTSNSVNESELYKSKLAGTLYG